MSDFLESWLTVVDFIDLSFDESLGLLVSVAFAELFFESVLVKSDSCADSVPWRGWIRITAPNHTFRYVLAVHQISFELFREDVLAIGGYDDILLTAGDENVFFSIEISEISGMEPTVLIKHFGSSFRILIVTHHYYRSAEADLTYAVLVLVKDLAFHERKKMTGAGVADVFFLVRIECYYR